VSTRCAHDVHVYWLVQRVPVILMVLSADNVMRQLASVGASQGSLDCNVIAAQSVLGSHLLAHMHSPVCI